MKRTQEWWDLFFLGIAEKFSEASKDPSTKVGCVIIDKKRRVVSTSYNGLPVGIKDTNERLNNRELKYKIVCHAEENSLLFCAVDTEGCTLFTWPIPPCSKCASLIIQSGISRVVSLECKETRWKESTDLSLELFREAGVSVKLY